MSEDTPIPPPTRKRKSRAQDTKEYVLMGLPEDPEIFAVMRKTRGNEKFTALPMSCEKDGVRIPVYERVIYLISPFYNHLTGEPGEPSCNCKHWITQKTRCVHLRKFFEVNPQLDVEPSKPSPPECPSLPTGA